MKSETTVRDLIRNLDLTRVYNRVKREHPTWSENLLKTAEEHYRGFLFVCWKYYNKDFRPKPSQAVDEFWHAHILYTQKYTKDCDDIFERYLHHLPE